MIKLLIIRFAAIKKFCSIASFFKHSSKFKVELYAKQKSNGKVESALIQKVVTRWNSLYFMLQRIIKIYEEIDEVLDSDKDYRKYLLSENEISNVETIVKILEPFEFITN